MPWTRSLAWMSARSGLRSTTGGRRGWRRGGGRGQRGRRRERRRRRRRSVGGGRCWRRAAELHAQDRGLDLIQAPVHADFVGDVVPVPAVLAQGGDPVASGFVAGGQDAAIAQRAEILGGVEAEGRDLGECAELAAAQGRAVGLAAILDQGHAVIRGRRNDRPEVGGLAVEMDRDRGRGSAAGRGGGLLQHRRELGGVHGVVQGSISISNGVAPAISMRGDGGDRGVGDGGDGAARADPRPRKASASASVPLAHRRAWVVPSQAAYSASNARPSLPRIYQPESSARATAVSISALLAR